MYTTTYILLSVYSVTHQAEEYGVRHQLLPSNVYYQPVIIILYIDYRPLFLFQVATVHISKLDFIEYQQ